MEQLEHSLKGYLQRVTKLFCENYWTHAKQHFMSLGRNAEDETRFYNNTRSNHWQYQEVEKS